MLLGYWNWIVYYKMRSEADVVAKVSIIGFVGKFCLHYETCFDEAATFPQTRE